MNAIIRDELTKRGSRTKVSDQDQAQHLELTTIYAELFLSPASWILKDQNHGMYMISNNFL